MIANSKKESFNLIKYFLTIILTGLLIFSYIFTRNFEPSKKDIIIWFFISVVILAFFSRRIFMDFLMGKNPLEKPEQKIQLILSICALVVVFIFQFSDVNLILKFYMAFVFVCLVGIIYSFLGFKKERLEISLSYDFKSKLFLLEGELAKKIACFFIIFFIVCIIFVTFLVFRFLVFNS